MAHPDERRARDVDRTAVLRHLPLALAGHRHHRAGDADGARHVPVRRQRDLVRHRHDRARRSVVPVRRGTDPGVGLPGLWADGLGRGAVRHVMGAAGRGRSGGRARRDELSSSSRPLRPAATPSSSSPTTPRRRPPLRPRPRPSAAPRARRTRRRTGPCPTGDQIDVFGDSLIATTRAPSTTTSPASGRTRSPTGGGATGSRRSRPAASTPGARWCWRSGPTPASPRPPWCRPSTPSVRTGWSSWSTSTTRTRRSSTSRTPPSARVASTRPNVIVADWNTAIRANLGLLQADKVHPGIPGAHLFAKTVRAALAELSTRHTGQPVVLKELKGP